MSAQLLSYEATSRFAAAGDITLHYHEAGTGPTLILLHGGGPGASAWSNWKQNLAPLAESFRVLLVDQPGYGRSDKQIVPGGMWTHYAAAVRGLMDTLGIEQANFVGNSLGGGTTLKFALDYPERADRLILMGPGGGTLPLTTPWPTEGFKQLLSFYNPPGPSKDRMRDLINIMMFDPSLVDADVLEERYQAAIDPDAMAYAEAVLKSLKAGESVLVAEELWREVHRIQHRTLLTWGRDDRVLPLDGAFYMMRAMPDARLHVFPRCGHWAQVEHAVEFNRLVSNFLTVP